MHYLSPYEMLFLLCVICFAQVAFKIKIEDFEIFKVLSIKRLLVVFDSTKSVKYMKVYYYLLYKIVCAINEKRRYYNEYRFPEP